MQIRVKVNASSRSESVRRLEAGFYQVRTAAPAEGGRANRRVVELLAAAFGVTPDQVRIVAGAARPLKLIELDGVAEVGNEPPV